MKKLIALAMAAVMCLTLTACTPKSQDVKQTEIMIRAIEEVTDQSGEAIVLAENMYRRLSEEEKGQVKNYSSLVQAREKYNQLIHYGQWVQFFDKEAVTFTLNDDGSFTMSDGRSGKYEIADSFVVLLTDDGETITFEKEVKKNLLHLKTDDADYIRPDLLTVEREKVLSSTRDRYFNFNYHLHIERDEWGLDKDYWYSLQVQPVEEYMGIVAPGTELTLTYTYTTRDVATLRKVDVEELLIMEEISDPVQQEKTVTLTAEAFMTDECCNEEYDLARGVTSQYKDYKNLIRQLELIENAELVSAEGYLYYYDQLIDTGFGGLYID